MGFEKKKGIKKSLMIRKNNISVLLWKILPAIALNLHSSGSVGPLCQLLKHGITLFFAVLFRF